MVHESQDDDTLHRRGLMLILSSPSGAGKTTIARKLLAEDNEIAASVSVTTRPMRPGEVEGKDYYFLTDAEYDEHDQMGWLIGQVREELLPARYGTPLRDMHPDKTNVLVLSIEGFLDAMSKVRWEDRFNVVFIKNVEPEVAREGRDQKSEEIYISAVLHWAHRQEPFKLVEIDHAELKEFRDDPKGIIEFA